MAANPIGTSTLRPEDLTARDLPVVLRGYDRERVDRFLARAAAEFALTHRQNQVLRERLRLLEDALTAAEGEAAASARSVADLMRRVPPAEREPARTPESTESSTRLEARLARSEAARERALAELREVTAQAASSAAELAALEAEHREADHRPETPPDDDRIAVANAEAERLLEAAAIAAEEVRVGARAKALRTLKKSRELAALVDASTARERESLAELEAHRTLLQARVDEILADAHDEAGRIVARIEESRDRTRAVLAAALDAHDADGQSAADGLLADLESRLREASDPRSG